MNITAEERRATRRQLSQLLEDQLRNIASDLDLENYIGSRASPSEIARDIVQVASGSSEKWDWLQSELNESYSLLLRSDGNIKLTPAHEAKMYGLLREVWQTHPDWVKTALVLSTQNIFLDRDYSQSTLENILAPSIAAVRSEMIDGPKNLPTPTVFGIHYVLSEGPKSRLRLKLNDN